MIDLQSTKQPLLQQVLKSVCHLSITVKSNLLAFNELLHSPATTASSFDDEDNSGSTKRGRGKSVGSNNRNNSTSLERPLSEHSAYSGSDGALSNLGNSLASSASAHNVGKKKEKGGNANQQHVGPAK